MKNILITGVSGEIGGATARLFQSRGWGVYLLLRSFEKPDVQQMMQLPNVHVFKVDLESTASIETTLQSLHHEGIRFTVVFHGAGMFLWDDGYPAYALPQPFETVRDILFRANVQTKNTVVEAFEKVYQDQLKNVIQVFIGSHAANFTADGPERTGKYKEEGYVVHAMLPVQKKAHALHAAGVYKDVLLFEPGLVNSDMARKAFTEERVEYRIDWSTVDTPAQYAQKMFPETFFTTGQ